MDNNLQITLKAARINAGLTQQEAANKLDISVSSLQNYEKGTSFPNAEVIKRIENTYSISYNNLIFLPRSTV